MGPTDLQLPQALIQFGLIQAAQAMGFFLSLERPNPRPGHVHRRVNVSALGADAFRHVFPKICRTVAVFEHAMDYHINAGIQ